MDTIIHELIDAVVNKLLADGLVGGLELAYSPLSSFIVITIYYWISKEQNYLLKAYLKLCDNLNYEMGILDRQT
jgi:hypothetical protein